MDRVKKWFTNYFFWKLYQRYHGKGWTILCKSPMYLNVAFPDNSVQYFIASFSKQDKIHLVGQLPPAKDVSYMAITVYDTMGVPVSSLFDHQISHKRGRYEVELGRDLSIPSTSYYCVIVRFYITDPTDHMIHFKWVPTIFSYHQGCEQDFLLPSMKIIEKETNQVEKQIVTFLSRRSFTMYSDFEFFLPATSQMVSFFINQDALYMIAFPRKENIMKITGVLPLHISRSHPIRFVGFMACNFQTTETDDSVGYMSLPQRYTIWVGYSRTKAKKYGYRDGDLFLEWKRENAYPMVVYREVRDDRGGLFLLQSETTRVTSAECKKVMGRHYPSVVAFP